MRVMGSTGVCMCKNIIYQFASLDSGSLSLVGGVST